MKIDYEKICDAIVNEDKKALPVLHKFVQAYATNKMQVVKKLQATGTGVSTDVARVERDTMDLIETMLNADMSWEQAYKTMPLARGTDSWEIHTVDSGLTIRKVKEGERIDVAGLTGSKVTVYVDKYGGALGWTDEMIRFRKIAAMADKMETFANRFAENKASNHYTLLATAGALNQTVYQGTTGDGVLRRDVKTINKAQYDLGKACKDKGYGDTATAPMVIYADPIFRERIEAAFTATTPSLAGALGEGQQVLRNVRRFYTFNSAVSGKILLVLPGNKIQKAEALAPTSYNDYDILSMQYIQAVWSYYGAAVADTDQVRQVLFS